MPFQTACCHMTGRRVRENANRRDDRNTRPRPGAMLCAATDRRHAASSTPGKEASPCQSPPSLT